MLQAEAETENKVLASRPAAWPQRLNITVEM